MSTMTAVDVSTLEIVANPRDVRRDLQVFVDYVRSRQVKRTVRGNTLGTGDSQKLARLFGLQPPDARPGGFPDTTDWLGCVDGLAYDLGITHFDTRGVYQGYSSREPSYPDNYVKFRDGAWKAFVERDASSRETCMLECALKGPNEFLIESTLGRLDRFDSSGSATGVMPQIDFPAARRLLLRLLARLSPGTWHATDALVAALKRDHPWFLIPEAPHGEPRPTYGRPRKGTAPAPSALGPAIPRYGNFYEVPNGNVYTTGVKVPDDAPDGFERVEGRWVERFLEGLPLLLGYVDVAYGEPVSPPGSRPSRGRLRAFRVHERLRLALVGGVPPPTVTVQPNFEVLVESPFHPLQVVERLGPACDVLSSGPVTTLRLRREKVTALRAADPGFDAAALLRELATRPVPQNVEAEVAEWTGHGDAFTLYEGFGLLECEVAIHQADRYVVEEIAPGIRLVRDPQAVHAAFEQAERNPLLVRHGDDRWAGLAAGTRTIFPTAAPAKAKAPRPSPIPVQRSVQTTLRFPDATAAQRVRKALVDAGCVVHLADDGCALRFAKQFDPQVAKVLKALGPFAVQDVDPS